MSPVLHDASNHDGLAPRDATRDQSASERRDAGQSGRPDGTVAPDAAREGGQMDGPRPADAAHDAPQLLCPIDAAGRLDPTFGDGGLSFVIPPSPEGTQGIAVAIQEGVGIVALGDFGEWGLLRATPSGVLDPSFGSDGITSGPTQWVPAAVTVAPQGRIYAIGTYQPAFPAGFAVARYLPTGALDTTFGALVTTFLGDDQALGLAVQPDGRLVVSGVTSTSATSPVSFAVARYVSDGGLDDTFGDAGKVVTGSRVSGTQVALSGSTILLGGGDGTRLTVVALQANGSLDTSFGSSGTASSPQADGGIGASSIAVDSTGRVIQAGVVYAGGNADFELVRYLPTGALDTSFGTGGVVQTSFGGTDSATALLILPSGAIVAVGYSQRPYDGGTEGSFALARYLEDGSLDPTFGEGGRVITTFSPGPAYARIAGAALDGCGVVVTGTVSAPGSAPPRFVLARYLQ